MSLQFGSTFRSEFDKFLTLSDRDDFLSSVVPFAQFIHQVVMDDSHPMRNEILNWRVRLFNEERHELYAHQVTALTSCLRDIVLSVDLRSGYCFMPTSAGKGHILIALAGCAIGDFILFKILDDALPGFIEDQPYLIPVLISLSLEFSKIVHEQEKIRTQVLVHDVEILNQLKDDAKELLGDDLSSKIEFHSVQALSRDSRRRELKYVIIDECHWGNASPYETIQSDLVQEIKDKGGRAFGFTASPYEHPDGKFQKTWSQNRVNAHYDFNYYIDNNIVYPVTLREVNLQNARPDFEIGAEEVDLTEKSQVIEFMVNHMMATFPENELDAPGVCYFNPVIIPDIVSGLLNHSAKSKILEGKIKVLASENATFSTRCRDLFGSSILATDDDIKSLKAGERILLISAQKLLVGLNAPYLKYCFISPTNSKIKIMQAIGRLMRPTDFGRTPKKLATLFLTSLTGRKLDLGAKTEKPDSKELVEESTLGEDDLEDPSTRYKTTSMTLSEAYDLPIKVFYKYEVGFKDFINQRLVGNPNAVERLKTYFIPKSELDQFDPIQFRNELSRLRDICRTNYRDAVFKRDGFRCQGKNVLGSNGCDRTLTEVPLDIHHIEPFTFAKIFKDNGPEGTVDWHRRKENLKYLVSLCPACHEMLHRTSRDTKRGIA